MPRIHTYLSRPGIRKATLATAASAAIAAGLILPSQVAMAAPSAADSSGLQNASFEEPVSGTTVPGWDTTLSNAVAETSSDAHDGNSSLEIRFTGTGTATIQQRIHAPRSGTFRLSGWAKSSGIGGASFAYGKNTLQSTGVVANSSWQPIVVNGAEADKGQVTIRITASGTAGQTIEFDGLTLTPAAPTAPVLLGGDMSEVDYVESSGGVYRDENGNQVDPFQFMADHGVKIARLRLYNETGPAHHRIGDPTSYIPAGVEDPSDILKLARRAHAAGMQIELTFHYSDYWTNGGLQDIPLDWRNVTSLPQDQAIAELTNDVSTFTTQFLQKMNAQGTPPSYVSLGNETGGGMLFPYGTVENFGTFAQFLTAGANAVHQTTPGAKVIVHLDDAGNDAKYNWYFGELESYHVPYDVIGASYYPYWTQKDIPTVMAFFQRMKQEFNKPTMIMETGVNWNPVTSDGVPGQLPNQGPIPYPATPDGQRDFLLDFFASIKALPVGTVVGDLYWDPVMIEAPGVGWQYGAPNVVDNTTLFDFDGKALPAFQAYEENDITRR